MKVIQTKLFTHFKVPATILPTYSPSHPAKLSVEHGSQFDLETQNRHRQANRVLQNEEIEKGYILLEIQNCLKGLKSKPLDQYGLPSPPQNLDPWHTS